LRPRKDGRVALRDHRDVKPADLLDARLCDVLATPAAVRVLLDRRMHCVGCPFARFETVAEAAAIYGMDPTGLARALFDAGVRLERP
jgi:hybrid cluster-associated redox disulfide protein